VDSSRSNVSICPPRWLCSSPARSSKLLRCVSGHVTPRREVNLGNPPSKEMRL
jgi:hypothetical protein